MNETIDPLYLRQVELEVEAEGIGKEIYNLNLNKNLTKGRGDQTVTGRFLISRMVNPVSEGITAFVTAAFSGKAGPKADAALILRDLDPYKVAYLVSKKVVSRLVLKDRVTMLDLARLIARSVESEARFDAFKKHSPGLFNKVLGTEEATGSSDSHKETVLRYAMNAYEIPWETWSRDQGMRLGLKLLEIVHEHTGVILFHEEVTQASKTKFKTQYLVEFTEETGNWIEGSLKAGMQVYPAHMPMVHVPRDWTDLLGGGYLSSATKPLPLVKQAREQHLRLLREADLSRIYGGLNAIQRTRWQVNKEVLSVFRALSLTDSMVAGLPRYNDTSLPPKPFDIDTNAEALKKWKWDAREVHTANRLNRTKRNTQSILLKQTERFADEVAIYFPHNLDFRGRAYPIPGVLQPQGNDIAKALLRFTKGKPVTETGRFWLAVHGANCFGVDKVPFEDRVDWVANNTDRIMETASDPLGCLWWTEAYSPWCFLAWAFEWARLMNEGENFLNHIPVALDGSCNGLQHYSAMLLDEVGGSAVNLVDLGTPQDIYQRVADEVIRKLKIAAALTGDEDTEKQARWAYAWLNFGIDRKITKRPVMVLPYGGTGRSCMNYVEEAIREKIEEGKQHNLGDELFPAIGFLAGTVWASIGDVVIAARGAMEWLQKTSRLLSKENKPIHWETPSGFIAYQRIMNTTYRRIKTHIHGKVVRPALKEETDKIHAVKQATSISPNFVHSMDASAMILTVYEANLKGLEDFAMVHDSFGTHAEDIPLLARTLREVFVAMYEGKPLEHFRNEVSAQLELSQPEPLPPEGKLNVRGVLNSPYFFA